MARDLPSTWTHNAGSGFPATEKGRRAAIEALYDEYDAKPGRRRTSARDAFDVYQSRYDENRGGWVLYVRRRRR